MSMHPPYIHTCETDWQVWETATRTRGPRHTNTIWWLPETMEQRLSLSSCTKETSACMIPNKLTNLSSLPYLGIKIIIRYAHVEFSCSPVYLHVHVDAPPVKSSLSLSLLLIIVTYEMNAVTLTAHCTYHTEISMWSSPSRPAKLFKCPSM